MLNLRWRAGVDSGAERRNPETERQIHEGSEEKNGGTQEAEDWGRTKAQSNYLTGEETSARWLMIFTIRLIYLSRLSTK